ncbi:MAG TPA: DUF6624 domain-containing protein [Candidatus Saccharimonadales bacterium]|nr:DUF6624 domain-containing protein [Candidatus Saccharimonadales bacterium]
MNEHTGPELIKRAERDVKMREKTRKSAFHWKPSIDTDNEKYLKKVVEQDGWPTISSVGATASQAAWLIVHHAHDVEFQKRCLALMHNLPDGEIDKANIAFLEDRILINEGKPQKYGTQFEETGLSFGPYPIEDERNLDIRRAEMDLQPFAVYKASMIELYRPKKHSSEPGKTGQ